MAQQAGIYKITLYEDKNLTYLINPSGDIVNLATGGDILYFTNCLTPQIDVSPVLNGNAKMNFNYTARIVLEDYDDTTLDELQKLYESMYGWKMLVYFYDGSIKFLDEKLRTDNSSAFDINQSMTIGHLLNTAQPTDVRFIDYDSTGSMSEYKADTTLITADSTAITADYY